MIHWGSSIPCTLYVNNRKECDFHLPDDTSWKQFTTEVSQQFNIQPINWYYTYSNLSASEELASEETFRSAKALCRGGLRDVLQVNACTEPRSDNNNVVREESSFELAVEMAVQRYLTRRGPELIRDLAHQNKVCCCNRNVHSNGSHQEVVHGDMVLMNSDIFPEPPSTTSSFLDPTTSPFLDPSTSPFLDPSTGQSNSLLGKNKKAVNDESSESSSSKRLKVMLGDKEYILAPCQNNIKTVTPGTKVTVIWNVAVKRSVAGKWEVVEEGGTLPPTGDVTWSQSPGNILAFSAEFTAPIQEGTYDSKWCLLQDSIKRESFTFCKLVVQTDLLSGENALASFGNVPLETSVPKLLNSNKVFCMTRSEVPGSEDDNS